MTNSSTGALRAVDDKGNDIGPDIRNMHAALTEACDSATDQIAKMVRDENLRLCKWAGQQDNGRKPATVHGRAAEPWANSADTRIPLVDSLIVDQVAMMKAAERRAKLVVRGTESGDMQRAGKVQIYLDHLRLTRIRNNVRTEAELAANWRQTHGRAVMAITWRQEWARDYETITLEGLQALAQQQPQSPVAQLLASLYEPDRDVKAALAKQLVAMYPDLELTEAYRQLQALRNTGAMTLPVRALRVNEPRWEALKPWRDAVYPLNTEREDTAQWIAWRWVGSAAQVEEKALSEEWGEEFVEAVLKTGGQTTLETRPEVVDGEGRRGVFRDSEEEMRGLFEVFYFYYTHTDKLGVPCKYCTVMSPHVAAVNGEMPHGPDKPVGYDHGKFPFVFMRRDRPDRMIEESRGVPEIAGSAQWEIKYQRDNRINQAELVMQPPTIRPEREIGLPLKIQPRGEVGERRAQATRFMSVPALPASQPLEAEAERDINRYFARNRVEDPVRAGMHDQVLADDWCEELADCWAMTLQLAQQFESDVTFARIVGGRPVPFHARREEIAGKFDLQLFFNTDVLDPEKMRAKAELAQKVFQPMDRYGVLNFAPMLQGMAQTFFPEWADEIVQGVEQGGAKEIADEQNNWALMMAGERPAMHEEGQNFALRLQWLEQKVQQPGAQMRLASLPDSKALVEERREHLKFMVDQFTVNAQAGRVGVKQEPAA